MESGRELERRRRPDGLVDGEREGFTCIGDDAYSSAIVLCGVTAWVLASGEPNWSVGGAATRGGAVGRVSYDGAGPGGKLWFP
jgi:hypothetical protein